jgi:hypothetical protein
MNGTRIKLIAKRNRPSQRSLDKLEMTMVKYKWKMLLVVRWQMTDIRYQFQMPEVRQTMDEKRTTDLPAAGRKRKTKVYFFKRKGCFSNSFKISVFRIS